MESATFDPNGSYHVYNRGVNRGAIFFSTENYRFFLRRFREYCQPAQGEVIAYCLMPTHYHFLLQVKSAAFGRRVMQPFGTSYVKAVNKRLNRVGPLFQGRYRAKPVTDDRYLINLTRYIHLNPVTARYVSDPGAWPFSSYLEYVGLRNGTLPQPHVVLNRFQTRAQYQAFVESTGQSYPGDFVRWLELEV